MGTISVVIARFWWSFYPALCFFAFIGVRLLKKQSPGSVYDTLPPVLIATGVCIMYSATTKNDNYSDWNKQFWFGEALVIGIFLYNSLGIPELQRHRAVLAGVAGCSLLAALWLRGRFWNYALLLILIAVVAILVALAFPLMEILLEAIINEKLRKVGDKVRHHHQVLQQHYEQQARKENR